MSRIFNLFSIELLTSHLYCFCIFVGFIYMLLFWLYVSCVSYLPLISQNRPSFASVVSFPCLVLPICLFWTKVFFVSYLHIFSLFILFVVVWLLLLRNFLLFLFFFYSHPFPVRSVWLLIKWSDFSLYISIYTLSYRNSLIFGLIFSLR